MGLVTGNIYGELWLGAKPSLFTIMLLNARITTWNSFFWTMLVINSDKNRTLPLGIYQFSGEHGGDNEIIMAGSTVIIVRDYLIYLCEKIYSLEC